MTGPGAAGGEAPAIVLFDGVCAFCNGSARWLAARDALQRLRFAPLQGETAAALRARHPEIPQATETLVLVEREAGVERVSLRSAAVFRLLVRLDPPWRRLARLRPLLPAALWDVLYRAFAAIRYRLFGRYESCPLPTPEWKARFLP